MVSPKSTERKNAPLPFRSECPISCSLEILGDKWTLIVIRDLLLGKRRYGEFVQSPERIPTNILAERLKRLEAHGLITKQPYQNKPRREEYLLTPKGLDLAPVLAELAKWAERHLLDTPG